MIITENKTGVKFKSLGRHKKINFSTDGRAYFMWHNRRNYLDEIMRCTYPIMCYKGENVGDIDKIISGYIGISNCYGVLVAIEDGGEYVTLWTEIDD